MVSNLFNFFSSIIEEHIYFDFIKEQRGEQNL